MVPHHMQHILKPKLAVSEPKTPVTRTKAAVNETKPSIRKTKKGYITDVPFYAILLY